MLLAAATMVALLYFVAAGTTSQNLGQFVASRTGVAASSSFSRARSACSVSDCELTETYSPAAIDMAPATRPATPVNSNRSGTRSGSHTEDQAGRRNDPVIGAEHGRSKPADPLDEVDLAENAAHDTALQN